jgi:hypothetical protein
MGFSQSGVQTYTNDTPQAAFNWQDVLDHLGSTSQVGASPYDAVYKQFSAHAQNQLGGMDSLQNYLQGLTGNGPTLAGRQQTDQMGRQLQDTMSKGVAAIKENPYASGTRASSDLLGNALAPSITGLYGQQSANANAAQQTGLNAAQQLQGIPGATNQLMGANNALNQNYWTGQQMNTGISQQNTQNQLSQGSQYGQLAQLISSLTSNYMLPNQGQQFGQAALGGGMGLLGTLLNSLINPAGAH